MHEDATCNDLQKIITQAINEIKQEQGENFNLAKMLSGKLNDALSGRLFYADFGSHGGNSHFKNGCFCELFS